MATKSKKGKRMPDDVARDLADGKWWRNLGERIGWRLYGWTYRSQATFITNEIGSTKRSSIEVSGEQANQLRKALGMTYEATR